MSQEMRALVAAYAWPSQAYWRYFELKALRAIAMERPILEIGCGDGRFSALLFDEIDEAIDLNPKAVARAQAENLYCRVRCADARHLDGDGRFATVYANCVMEHIPGIEAVLGGCYRTLRPGGRLVMTVPFEEMNRHLFLRSAPYARWRQRRLAHHNLLDLANWCRLLGAAGFRDIAFRTYLGGNACRFWDSIDVIGCLGWGRFCVATAAGMFFRILSRPQQPSGLKCAGQEAIANNPLQARVSEWMEQQVSRNDDLSQACAAVILASKLT